MFQLQAIFYEILGLSVEQALDFARFLIEEKDEEQPNKTTIEFDPKRQVNSQYIPIRLMTSFRKYPTLFTEAKEKEIMKAIQNEIPAKIQKQLVQKLNDQEEAIISKEHFYREMKKISKASEEDLDCMFIFLSRGGHMSQFDDKKS